MIQPLFHAGQSVWVADTQYHTINNMSYKTYEPVQGTITGVSAALIEVQSDDFESGQNCELVDLDRVFTTEDVAQDYADQNDYFDV